LPPISGLAQVIVATNKESKLGEKMRTFRKELCAQVKVIHIKMASLRELAEDILPIWRYLVAKYRKAMNMVAKKFTLRC
jgi:DNA-binding NtrC family response regulator